MVISELPQNHKKSLRISPTGGIHSLLYKPGKGPDFLSMGEAEVTRASEILWDSPSQSWYVKILDGEFSGRELSYNDLNIVYSVSLFDTSDKRALFTSYDLAVEAEVRFINYVMGGGSL